MTLRTLRGVRKTFNASEVDRDEQRHEPNDYVGLPISREKATKDAQDVLERLERVPFEIPRSGSKPPTFMYGAPVFSISHQFPNLMVLTPAVQILEDASAHLDPKHTILDSAGN
ncbi:hypothetical protein CC86DRAFT_436508 [Ophiobolus disseminans]|uniref:Uncharacterized protein n=1 Tax=Ophiobolus disseminans TaxID=1469910 RepID=A0A6A6ZAA7_9PLEO|nr:hypothetical protein CC86DRAFT_436508 [Ophiobolus disseminans]